MLLLSLFLGSACDSRSERQDVRPLVLRDVPAQRLAYRFEADTAIPPEISAHESSDRIEAIQTDFTSRRPDDALLRTVVSPDSQRVLALYGTEGEPSQVFRIDMYSTDGKFLRNLVPPDLSCVFPETVSWSPDGTLLAFVARKRTEPSPTPTPLVSDVDVAEPSPSPSLAPAFPFVQTFNTEQIYVCNRDGYDLKPLTSREGLIYFSYSWSPDRGTLVALACKENEWETRERDYKMPAGRPRLVSLDGKERLLDDRSTEAQPVWSPDASKVATAFENEVGIYDAATREPTQARIRLREALLTASVIYEERHSTGKKRDENEKEKDRGKTKPAEATTSQQTSASETPPSFNPIVRLEWTTPEKLYFQTAFVRLLPNQPITTFPRWHLLIFSAQAAVLKQ